MPKIDAGVDASVGLKGSGGQAMNVNPMALNPASLIGNALSGAFGGVLSSVVQPAQPPPEHHHEAAPPPPMPPPPPPEPPKRHRPGMPHVNIAKHLVKPTPWKLIAAIGGAIAVIGGGVFLLVKKHK